MRYDDYLQEQLKNPDVKKEWDDLQPEMDVIRAMIDARIKNNLTQKELAARTGIDQADISKLENGTRNPSLKLLKRLAHGMGMQLKICINAAVKKIKLNGCCNNTKQTFECRIKSTFKGHFLRRNHEHFTDSNKCKIHTFKPRSLFTARLCRGVQGCCGACGIHDKQSKGLHS